MSSRLPDSTLSRVWPCCRAQIDDWFRYLIANVPVRPPDPLFPSRLQVFTDSSQFGWGVIIIDQNSSRTLIRGGRFMNPHHINVKEAMAVKISIDIIRSEFHTFPRAISFFIDNTSVLGALRRGRSPAFLLNQIVCQVKDLIPSSTHISFAYIPSSQNPADAPSRGAPCFTDIFSFSEV